jgi:putative ABC transport system ATP-binding protein
MHLTPAGNFRSQDAGSMTSAALAQLRGVTRVHRTGWGPVPALRDITVDIRRGEFLVVTGASGSGKSTLLNILGGLDQPTSGSYRLQDVEVGLLSEASLARLRGAMIGFVFQQFALLPRLDALENVMLGTAYSRCPREERQERSRRALNRVGLSDRVRHRPSQLSGGQQQRVAIARALVNNPSLILADEPTGALDSQTAEEIMTLFESLAADGHTLVVVTHDPNVAARGSRCIRLRDGRVVDRP